MPRTNKGPEFVQYFDTILKALKELGGVASAGDVVDMVARIKNVSEADQEKRNKAGALRFYNQVAWSRQYLIWGGYLDGSQRGIWRLTEKGIGSKGFSHSEALELFKQQHALHVSAEKRDEPETSDNGEESPSKGPDEYKEKLLSVLRSLPPAGFERLCQRLLHEYGLEKVQVTGRSGDGGVDGIGILKVNKFVTFKVMFQCKRYSDAVGPDKVREFRGAMHGSTDKGIMFTTGTFTKNAQAEALSKVPQIELVDGEGLVLLFEELKLGLVTRTTYDLDLDFFEQFKTDE